MACLAFLLVSAVCAGGVGLAASGAGTVVGFGEVVESYGGEGGFGDAFGAVADGGLADEAGEGSDAAGGAPGRAG
ncbi:hypothetical protein GCM10010276_22450 [Streptomyces longisporus]|uniref:Secreted protein n=1 Tax=Streptomyces longisporus TaxID=1948 RepID=A0ABP5YVY1_STRLO